MAKKFQNRIPDWTQETSKASILTSRNWKGSDQ